MPASAEVHRDLHLTTPFERGDDIEQLQHGIDSFASHHKKLGLHRVGQDGELGPHTLDATGDVAYALGLKADVVKAIRHGAISEYVQHSIRHPEGLGADAHKRFRARQPGLIKRAHEHELGAHAAVAWLLKQVGTTEHPLGSNWGHPVEDWIKETGYSSPVFWCGCFAHHGIVIVAKAKIPNGNRLGYSGYIDSDARAHVNGLRAISLSEARLGDLVTFCFDGSGRSDHIATCTGPVAGGVIPTVDGNSSASDGSNNNGGEVATHKRSTGLVVTVARPTYA